MNDREELFVQTWHPDGAAWLRFHLCHSGKLAHLPKLQFPPFQSRLGMVPTSKDCAVRTKLISSDNI